MCCCTPSTRTLVDLAAKRARRSPASAAPDALSSAACLQTTSTCALGPRAFGQPVLAPWQLRALQRDPRLRRKRLAKQAAGGHVVDAEDYVDAVYMVLAAAAHAQANAACDALVWNPPRRSVRRRLLLLCASPGNSTHFVVRPPCGR